MSFPAHVHRAGPHLVLHRQSDYSSPLNQAQAKFSRLGLLRISWRVVSTSTPQSLRPVCDIFVSSLHYSTASARRLRAGGQYSVSVHLYLHTFGLSIFTPVFCMTLRLSSIPIFIRHVLNVQCTPQIFKVIIIALTFAHVIRLSFVDYETLCGGSASIYLAHCKSH